jgi:hypothetical protein
VTEERILVVGTGQVCPGIALSFALGGNEVVLSGRSDEKLAQGLAWVQQAAGTMAEHELLREETWRLARGLFEETSTQAVLADHVAAHHLKKVRAPAGCMPPLPRGHEAWAHRPALDASALPHSEAALGCCGEATPVVAEAEVGRQLARVVVRANAKVVIDVVGIRPT